MRARSRRMQAVYRDRGPLVADFLDRHPTCERCGRHRATEVHEVLSRGRGGSVLDESNLKALCHDCHRFVTEHPQEATVEGLLRSASPHRFVLGSRMRCAVCQLPPQHYGHRIEVD